MKKYYSHIGANLSASIVVLLVALPLCLGIALASGAPLFSGIIAGSSRRDCSRSIKWIAT